ncbi:VOC family protein [Kitasatospora sp. NPDC088391]|uniref:VOC family protein n=1 Tax=Kitasatospora sp. NPDC088391 TaxID=3364074 RepID=UPI00380D2806
MKITESAPGEPCWVELVTADPATAKTFYHELFGWRAEAEPVGEGGESAGRLGMYLGDRLVAAITAPDRPGRPAAWTIGFHTPDADSAAGAVTAAGGELVAPPADAPGPGRGRGRGLLARDPGGALFAARQPAAAHGVDLRDEPGALGWVELATRDPRTVAAFYARLFGWSVAPGETYTQFGLNGRDFGGMADMADQFPADTPPYWMPYFTVADVDLSAERAALLGATVTLPPTDVPDGPRLAILRDPADAVFGIHVPL